jgi:hypothetical protein
MPTCMLRQTISMGERVVVSSPLIICQTLIHFQLQSYGVEKLDSKNTKDDEDLTLHFLSIVIDSRLPQPSSPVPQRPESIRSRLYNLYRVWNHKLTMMCTVHSSGTHGIRAVSRFPVPDDLCPISTQRNHTEKYYPVPCDEEKKDAHSTHPENGTIGNEIIIGGQRNYFLNCN